MKYSFETAKHRILWLMIADCIRSGLWERIPTSYAPYEEAESIKEEMVYRIEGPEYSIESNCYACEFNARKIEEGGEKSSEMNPCPACPLSCLVCTTYFRFCRAVHKMELDEAYSLALMIAEWKVKRFI